MLRTYKTGLTNVGLCLSAAHLQTGEADQVGTQTEAGTLAGSQANAGGKQIQESEGHGGHDGHSQDLLHIQLLLGDDEGGQGNGQTFQEVLDCASHELSNSESVHLIFRVLKISVAPASTTERALRSSGARLKPGLL